MQPLSKKIVISYMLLYLSFALFGAHFGLSSMKASAVLIPSGIALAFIVMYKKPILPWVFITSYASHILIAFVSNSVTPSLFLVGAFLGIYVTWGGYIIMKLLDAKQIDFLGSPKLLRVIYVFLIAVIITLVVSLMSSFTLFIFNHIQSEDFFHTFLSWWAGDFFGVTLATPYIIAITLNKEERIKHLYQVKELLLFIALILVFVTIFGLAYIPQYARSTQFYVFMILFIWPILRFNAMQSALSLFVLLIAMTISTSRGEVDVDTLAFQLIFQQFFIAVLAVYTWILSKMMQTLRDSKMTLSEQNDILSQTNNELRKLMDTMRVFFDLVVNTDKVEETDEILYASMVLNTAFRLVNQADYASIMTIQEDKVHFLDAIGYDVNTLNSLNMDPSKVEYYYDHVVVNTKGEENVKSNFKAIQAKGENRVLPPIKESIYVGIMVSDQVGLSISIDLKIDSKYHFSKSDTDNLRVLQAFLNGFYKMRAYNTMQHQLHEDVVSVLVNLLEQHDKYTLGHSEHVAAIAVKIAKKMKLSESEIMKIKTAARIHDIGKLWIPADILNKKEALTDQEYQLIKEHPHYGEQMVKNSVHMHDLALVVKHHHERYDGKGYPSGLKDNSIPLASRIIFVADAYDAMTSIRSYRSRLSALEALEEIKRNSNSQFDPSVVAAFVSLYEGGDIQ